MEDDKELILVENYLLKLRYSNDMKSKNNIDFGFLCKIHSAQRRKKQENECQSPLSPMSHKPSIVSRNS